MANKRDIIAARINEGGATQEILMEVAEVNKAGLSSQFTYLRLTGKFPVKGDDGIFSFITEEEWEAKKAAASTRGSSEPKKSPEERQEILLKRQARLQEVFGKKEEAFGKDASEKNRLRLQKAEADILLCNIEVDEVNTEVQKADVDGTMRSKPNEQPEDPSKKPDKLPEDPSRKPAKKKVKSYR